MSSAAAVPLFLCENDVAGLLTMPEAIAAVEAAFRDQAHGLASNHPRERFFLPGGVMHHMAAAWPARTSGSSGGSSGGVMGTKTYTSFAQRGTRFWVQLFSAGTGDLLAVIEADRLGQIRTGAATGVAAKYFARPDATAAALLGTGWQARSQAQALVAVLPNLQPICVYGRDAERRLVFCREMSDALGVPVLPAQSVEDALPGCQIVVCATTARDPILHGREHLSPGLFVAAVGANRMTAREIDEQVVGRADVVCVDDLAQARTEAAELVFAHEKRRFVWEGARPLAAVVAGHAPGRTNNEQITLFKSLGIALEDVAVAAVVYEKARAQNVGRAL